MDCSASETLEYKEGERHTNALTITAKDAPKFKITGGERQEGKEEADAHNTTPPMLHHR